MRDTSLDLTDAAPDKGYLEEIRRVALSVPGVVAVEKCFARRSGLQYHVDLHVEVDPDLRVREAHEIAGVTRTRLRTQLEWVADVLVHVEPAPGIDHQEGR
jgi:divalent metal cation (Fe/Co/Zn/Cd) transporter